MNVTVLNTDFKVIAVLDMFKSLIWTDRYQEAGDVEIYFAVDTELLGYLEKDNYLLVPDSEHVMIIEDIAIDSDIEEGNFAIVTGRSLESILDRRIIWSFPKVISGNLQDAIEELLDENIISPSNSDRQISNFVFKASEDEAITELEIDETQYTGDNLYEVIVNLCTEYDIGFKVLLDDDDQFVFSLYAGTDHSYNQETNSYVVFSPSFENIINSNYYTSKANYKNVTLVAGEGEGSDRKTTSVGSATGLDRRELFTDARDISQTVDDTTISDSEYKEQLASRGEENLEDYKIETAFEGEVEATKMFVYGEDFFVGDVVQVQDAYGNEGAAYVSELVITQDESGITVYPTFEMVDEDEDEEEEESSE